MIELYDRLFDPLAFLIVVGGSVFATFISSTRQDLGRAVAALLPLVRASPYKDAAEAARAVREIQRISEYRGRVCADRVKTPVDFVHRAACRLSDCESSEAFAAWAREDLDERCARHEAAASVWRNAADAGPAMGMIGTVLGLVFMFANMDDPSAMGPGMAAAMLTTLYGLVLAAGIAGPIAARLQRLSSAERRWQEKVIDRLLTLAREEEEAQYEWLSRRGQVRA
jgi:chemotaxis protein MotA